MVFFVVFPGNQFLKAPTEDSEFLVNALDFESSAKSLSRFEITQPGGVVGATGEAGLIGRVFPRGHLNRA